MPNNDCTRRIQQRVTRQCTTYFKQAFRGKATMWRLTRQMNRYPLDTPEEISGIIIKCR